MEIAGPGVINFRVAKPYQVDLLLGPYSSDITLAASTVAEENSFPMLTVGAAAEAIWQRGYKNVFGIDVPARAYMLSVVDMLKEHAPLRVALVYEDDAVFTRDMAEGARSQAAAHGLQIGHDMIYIQWQKDSQGKLVKQVVWPLEGKTADPLHPKP